MNPQKKSVCLARARKASVAAQTGTCSNICAYVYTRHLGSSVMAPKGRYTRNHLAAAAAESATAARASLPNSDTLQTLTCEYVHTPDETNAYADGALRRAAHLTFRRRLKTKAGHEEHFDVTARTNNATEQGVPLPPH